MMVYGGAAPDLPLPTASTITGPPNTFPPPSSFFGGLYKNVLEAFRPRNGTSTEKLLRLDELRYKYLPEKVEQRKHDVKADFTQGWLELGELEELMAWKLTRGTPRPKLKSLIASNPPSTVREVTGCAFHQYYKLQSIQPLPSDSSINPIRTLCKLKGVGPATASLILSVKAPKKLPFFADELLAWLRGWTSVKQGKIDYSVKEYYEIVEGVDELVERMKSEGTLCGATDVEKVAWVIMKLRDPEIWREVFGEDMSQEAGDELNAKANEEKREEVVKANGKASKRSEKASKEAVKNFKATQQQASVPDMKRKSKGVEVEQTAASKRPRRH